MVVQLQSPSKLVTEVLPLGCLIRNISTGPVVRTPMQLYITKGIFPTLRSYEVEMDEMVVMESQDLEDFQAGMERMVRQEPLDHRDLLDPVVEESLMPGGVELSAQTQMALNLSTKEELLEPNTLMLVVVVTISV